MLKIADSVERHIGAFVYAVLNVFKGRTRREGIGGENTEKEGANEMFKLGKHRSQIIQLGKRSILVEKLQNDVADCRIRDRILVGRTPFIMPKASKNVINGFFERNVWSVQRCTKSVQSGDEVFVKGSDSRFL